MIPTGWEHSELGLHVDLLTGYPFESGAYSEDPQGVRLLRGDNVMPWGVRWENAKRWDAQKASPLARFQLRVGDVVIAMDRTWIGAGVKVAMVTEQDLPSLLVQRVARLRAQVSLDQRYMFQLLSTHGFAQYVLSSKTETAVPHISVQHLNSFRLPIPPLPEQRKMAEILGAWDEAIEKLTLLSTAKRLRRTWFRTHVFTGKKRLPGFSGEWRRVQLSEVLTEHKNRSSGSEEVFSVSVHKGLVNQIEHLGRSFAAKDTAHYNQVLTGDIVYTKSPTGDFPLGIVKQSVIDHSVIVSPLYGVFSPVTRDLGVILDAYFESPVTLGNYLSPLVQKGAKNTIAITNSRFLEGHLVLPLDPAEQSAIARVIEAYQYELARIDAEIAALKQQKRGLMQKLLTGQWRVNMVDTA
jgi:type I restriction enzyme S subunit